MDFFINMNAEALWFILFLIFLVAELATAGALVSIWFCFGALASFAVAKINDNFILQFSVFLIISIALLILTKPFVNKVVKQKKEPTNSDMNIGAVGIVVEEIDNIEETGAVKLSGKIWTARNIDSKEKIAVNEEVRVLKIQGVKLIVEKV